MADENKKKSRLFDLPQTKGMFQIRGIVTGTEKDNFYKETKTKTGKIMRMVNFGVEYEEGSTLYINLNGMELDNVYFSKKAVNPGEKAETTPVPWSQRFTYNREGFRLIGKNIGVKKIINESGNPVNDKKILTDFDACKEIKDNLKDGVSVFIKGNVEYSSCTDDKGTKRTSVKLVPSQISLCGDIDFKDESYETKNDFNQVIVFVGVGQERENDKPTGRYNVQAKIVTYNNIEDAEFVIENEKLANKFRKSLKPYNAIRVNGHMITSTQTETVEDDDNWGEEDSLTKVYAPAKREFIVTGAAGSTLDTTIYTEENVSEAIMKINNAKRAESSFGDEDNEGWGTSDKNISDEDDDAWS